MAILSNVNGKFAVDSTGAIQFSGSAGTSGYILRSNGNAAPTWVDSSTVIGGPYLPLTGGTLSGALAGTSATFSGNVTLNTNGTNFTHGYSGNGLVLSHHNVGPSNAIVSGNSVYPDNLYINNGGSASDWSNVIIEGDVGIGTSTPDAKLHIYGSSTVSEMYLGEDAAVDKAGILKYNQGDGTGTGSVQLGNYGDSLNTTGVTIKKGGNVGIGTSSPTTKLQINAGTNRNLRVGSGIQGTTGIDIQSVNDAVTANAPLTLSGSLIALMEGNVGIGTITPSDKLQIVQGHSILVGDYFQLGSGSASIMGALGWNRDTTNGVIYNTNFGAFQMHNNEGKLCLQGYNSNGANQFQHEFYNNGDIYFEGNVLIGTTSIENPRGLAQALEIEAGSPVGIILNDSRDTHPMGIENAGAVMNFTYNTSPLMTILAGGNVGINTTSPLNKLQVNGDIGIGELNNTRSTNVRFAKNDVNVITFDISVAAIGAWRPGSCWIQVSGSQNGLQEYWSAWYFIRLTHYYLSGVAGQGTTNPSCILDSGGDTSQVIVGVSSTNSSNPQIITITLTDSGGTTNSMVADINCTMQVGINSIT